MVRVQARLLLRRGKKNPTRPAGSATRELTAGAGAAPLPPPPPTRAQDVFPVSGSSLPQGPERETRCGGDSQSRPRRVGAKPPRGFRGRESGAAEEKRDQIERAKTPGQATQSPKEGRCFRVSLRH